MIVLTFSQWLCAVAAAVCVGMSKSGISGIAMASILLMAQVFPPRESTGIILPMLIAADFLACSAFYQHAQFKHVWRMLPAACFGVVIGFFIMQSIPAEVYRRIIGWIVVVMTLLQGLKMRYRNFAHPFLQNWPFAASMGVTAGITTMMANAAGPVMALYLTVINLPKLEFVATSAFFFLTINLIKVPFSAGQGLISLQTLLFNLALLPAIALGVYAGRWIIHRISQRVFEWLILIFSAVAAIRLIVA